MRADAPIPHPYHLRAPSGAHLRRRTAQTLDVARRRLGPLATRKALGKPIDPARAAPRIVAACADLGATYVKFGQLVASAPSVFGEEVSVAFRALLDQGRPVGFHKVQHEVERATHEPLRTTFAEFDPEPVGRASMAVVHRAQLADGTDVAVKILRPGIERKVAADFQLMGWLIPRVASRVAGAQAQMIEPMLAGLRNQLCEELDLRNEARTMDHFNGLLTEVDLPSVAIPHTYPELSSRRVLVMEWFDGAAIDDLSAIEAFGVDPVPLVTDTVKAFFLTTARYGLFHGDVHAGNLLLLRDGRIGVLDWGIVGRLDEDNREAFCDIIRAALGDEEAWGRVTDRIVAQIGPLIEHRLGVTPDQIPAMVRAVLEPMFTKPFGEVKLSTLLLGPEELQGGRPGLAGVGGTDDVEGLDPAAFDRSMLLLAKQLLYFERYGQMYLSELSLLSDRDFFSQLVTDA
ncbi:MAG: AarF/ABC1/UbiB kinase family protein [Acidimicrobiales bacterium]|nr:AarF/ABC1/UbiB kinase family protein [Acidimicrobiales bacterium]